MLQQRVRDIYKSSWISKYYAYEIKTDKNIVFFWDKVKNSPVGTNHFKIFMNVPPLTQLYFLPSTEWSSRFSDNNTFLLVDLLSNVTSGFKTIGYPSSTSEFYTPPYFITFKTAANVKPNYLIFNSFFKPNSQTNILAMINYNEDQNKFMSDFAPGLTLPYATFLSLNKTLEFRIVDSTNKLVDIEDNCVLFITLTLE